MVHVKRWNGVRRYQSEWGSATASVKVGNEMEFLCLLGLGV